MNLLIRFFYIDCGIVKKASQSHVLDAWLCKKSWDDSTGTRELSLATVICDDSFNPLMIYLLHVTTENGWITKDSRDLAVRQVAEGKQPLNIEGWEGMLGQLAVALDMTAEELGKLPLLGGGPLPLSLTADIPVKKILLEYKDAFLKHLDVE